MIVPSQANNMQDGIGYPSALLYAGQQAELKRAQTRRQATDDFGVIARDKGLGMFQEGRRLHVVTARTGTGLRPGSNLRKNPSRSNGPGALAATTTASQEKASEQ
jgi:hypothetical protein